MSALAEVKPGRSSRGARVAFWLLACLGVVASAVAWVWYGAAQLEAQSEQSKALSAGTTMSGFAESIGGVPLVLAHLTGLAVTLLLGWRSYGKGGMAIAIAAVIVASGIGVIVAQILWGGELFQLGIYNDSYIP